MTILDVDLIEFERGDRTRRRAIVDGVRRSLETGFVYLRHDLEEAELDACYASLERFFSSPPETKRALERPDSLGQRGYTGLLVETAAGTDAADWKEHLNWGEAAAPGHPDGQRFPHRYGEPVLPAESSERLLRFHRQVAEFQRRFLRIVAEGLGAATDYFDAMTEHGAHLTRAVHYPPMTDAPDGPHVWAAEHGDINLVTALPRATAPGLQVRTVDGWQDVSPPPGHAVLNTGMMLERISNGVLPTGVHRVVAGPDQPGGRLAVVQFCHPAPSTMLTPLPSCVSTERPAVAEPVLAAEWLDAVLRAIGLA